MLVMPISAEEFISKHGTGELCKRFSREGRSEVGAYFTVLVKFIERLGAYALVQNEKGGIETLCVYDGIMLSLVELSKGKEEHWYKVTAKDTGDSPEVYEGDISYIPFHGKRVITSPTRFSNGLGI
jgi:hypothetical protein